MSRRRRRRRRIRSWRRPGRRVQRNEDSYNIHHYRYKQHLLADNDVGDMELQKLSYQRGLQRYRLFHEDHYHRHRQGATDKPTSNRRFCVYHRTHRSGPVCVNGRPTSHHQLHQLPAPRCRSWQRNKQWVLRLLGIDLRPIDLYTYKAFQQLWICDNADSHDSEPGPVQDDDNYLTNSTTHTRPLKPIRVVLQRKYSLPPVVTLAGKIRY